MQPDREYLRAPLFLAAELNSPEMPDFSLWERDVLLWLRGILKDIPESMREENVKEALQKIEQVLESEQNERTKPERQ